MTKRQIMKYISILLLQEIKLSAIENIITSFFDATIRLLLYLEMLKIIRNAYNFHFTLCILNQSFLMAIFDYRFEKMPKVS